MWRHLIPCRPRRRHRLHGTNARLLHRWDADAARLDAEGDSRHRPDASASDGSGLVYVACHLVTSDTALISSLMLDSRRAYVIGMSPLAGVGMLTKDEGA